MPKTNQNDSREMFRRDVMLGLSQEQKSLPCKYFYNEFGSQLFDQICELDEYYLTRAEFSILQDNAKFIAAQLDEKVMLVEYGSGSSTKTRVLLDSLIDPVAYVPVDISEEHLLKTAEGLRGAFPEVEILPVVADFSRPFELPTPSQSYSHVAIYFPGSTIGNFTPEQAGQVLGNMSAMLGPQGGLLIGIDLQKDISTIVAAYDDDAGITAQFNLNLLARINDELGGNFDLNNFSHKAVYNESLNRVEISIASDVEQAVSINGKSFFLAQGEEILTEYSHKYCIEGFAKLAGKHGFRLHQHWTDDRKLFGVLHFVLEGN